MTNKYIVQAKVEDKLSPVSLNNIELEGEIRRHVDFTIHNVPNRDIHWINTNESYSQKTLIKKQCLPEMTPMG